MSHLPELSCDQYESTFDFVTFVCLTGATSAPCLIFIFPAVFYIRIVPKEEEPSFSVPKILVSILCIIKVNRQRKAEEDKKLSQYVDWWMLQLRGLSMSRQTPVMSVRPLSLPGCLLCWDWLPVYDNEPQLHHHRLDFRHQQHQQWALNATFHFTEFILSVVTFALSILKDCWPQCCPAWAERTFILSHSHDIPLWKGQ